MCLEKRSVGEMIYTKILATLATFCPLQFVSICVVQILFFFFFPEHNLRTASPPLPYLYCSQADS